MQENSKTSFPPTFFFFSLTKESTFALPTEVGTEPTQHEIERLLGFGQKGIMQGWLESAVKAAIFYFLRQSRLGRKCKEI